MATDPNCVFCKIVAGQIPCFKLYEDGDTLAFMDINPVHDGHCLVISKVHYPTVFEVTPDAFPGAARTAITVATAVNTALRPDALNLVQSNRPSPPQSALHFPLHILPPQTRDALFIN